MRRLAPLIILQLLSITLGTAAASDWPHWRGPTRNGVSPEQSGWKGSSWLADKPAWQVQVGEGASSPIVVGKNLFTLGHQNGQDVVQCRDTANGKLLWSVSYKCKKYGRFATGDQSIYSGPSSTPEYDPDTGYLYTLSTDGHLNCWATQADKPPEKPTWSINLYDEFEVGQRPKLTRAPQRDYGYTTSPMVFNDWLLVEVGSTSRGSVLALDKRTGKVVWASELKDEPGHCGGMALMRIDDKPAIAVLTQRHLAVIRLDAGQTGKTIAKFPWVTDFANSIASPAAHGDSVIITSAYNQNAMVRLKVAGGEIEEVWRARTPSKVCTPVIHDGHVYVAWQRVRCLDWETGVLRWQGGAFGDPGSCIVTADERLIVYGLNGRLALIETAKQAPKEYTELAAIEKLFGSLGWPHVVLANGRIFCRDRDGNLACLPIP